jgi:hypothetical protein
MQKRLKISAESNYSFGSNIHLESSQGQSKVVFRDSGGEAYFSGGDATGEQCRLLIYSRAQLPSTNGQLLTQIAWSPSGSQAMLLVNQQPQAVFDFAAKRAYCRTSAAAPKSQWEALGHKWSEDALKFF